MIILVSIDWGRIQKSLVEFSLSSEDLSPRTLDSAKRGALQAAYVKSSQVVELSAVGHSLR
jgi:hypothetical protein